MDHSKAIGKPPQNGYHYSIAHGCHDTRPKPRHVPTFKALVERELSMHVEVNAQDKAAGLGPAIIPAKFRSGGRRCAADVETVCFIPLDCDNKHVDPEDPEAVQPAYPTMVQTLLEHYGWEAALYSSNSHTPDLPKFRTMIPLSRPATPSEYPALVDYAATALFGASAFDSGMLDRCSKKLSHPFFKPSCPKESMATAFSTHLSGRPLDVDWVLAHHKIPEPVALGDYDNVTPVRDHTEGALISDTSLSRRERLIRVFLAAWLAGAERDELIHRVRLYDERYHQPINGVEGPHFRKEKFRRAGKSPDQAAQDLVDRELRSLKSRYGDLSEQKVPEAASNDIPDRLENGTLCVVELTQAARKMSKRGPYWSIHCKVPGSRHRIMTSLFPDNPISRDLVRSWRRHIGREVPEERLMDNLDQLKGLRVGAKIRIQRSGNPFHDGQPEIAAFLGIAPKNISEQNNTCTTRSPAL